MTVLPPLPNPTLIDMAIARHGAARVLFAAIRALLHPAERPPDIRRRRPPDLRALNDHLRRDIGLPPRM